MLRNDEQEKEKNIANEVKDPDDNESRNNIKMNVNSDNNDKYLGVSSKIQQDFLSKLLYYAFENSEFSLNTNSFRDSWKYHLSHMSLNFLFNKK